MSGSKVWAWLDSAACADEPDLPWTADAAAVSAADFVAMGAVCETCPVLGSCRVAVSEWDVTAGWWAGSNRELSDRGVRWVQVPRGRSGRMLPGVLQGVLDFGDAA